MIGAETGPSRHDRADLGVDRSHGIGGRVRHLRVSLPLCGLLAIVGALVAFFTAGYVGAAGFAAGVLLVTGSYTASTLAIAWADWVNPRMVLAVGMAMYITKFSLFGALLIFVGGTEWAGTVPMAMGIVAAVVAWTGIQIWWTVKTEHPYVKRP
jgi:hypothetical protein